MKGGRDSHYGWRVRRSVGEWECRWRGAGRNKNKEFTGEEIGERRNKEAIQRQAIRRQMCRGGT